jgi:hypothetical protein
LCAMMKRRAYLAGCDTRPAPGSLRPVATLEVMEVTKWLKLLV